MNIVINGFGRIGRAVFKILLEHKQKGEDINIVAINDLVSPETMAYLLKWDTVYGIYENDVSHEEGAIVVGKEKYLHLSIKEPSELPWKDLNVDIVFECTGIFVDSKGAQKHIDAGAKKVIVSAPAKDDGVQTLVFGAGKINPRGNLISNASCTTNCVTPVIKILSEAFGVEKAMLTTVHAYTSTQNLVDGPHKKDPRRGRAAAQNIIPATTGAAKATAKVLPSLENIFDGVALRVPVICGSISDITAVLKKNTTVEEVNQKFIDAQNYEEYREILQYTDGPMVSSDVIKSPFSAIIDGQMTRVVGGNLVKVMAWYDNEWGYSNRLVEMALLVGSS